MSTSQDLLRELIQKLYRESSFRFHYSINSFGDNGYLMAQDGTYLGKISNKFDNDSIFNKFGTYGSKFSPNSIFNKFGTYGSKFSSQSPVNPYTATPPVVFLHGQEIGKLTVNKFVPGALPTDLFLFFLMSKMNVLEDRIEDFLDLISR